VNPLISVIIPVFNVESYLRECVDSVLTQTYRNLEIILIDDGSPDNSGSICDQYALMDSRIVVIHKDNGGLADARNVGIDVAHGEYLAFVDSDDWISKEFVESLVNMANSHNASIAVCMMNYDIIEEHILNDSSNSEDQILTSIQALRELYGDNSVNMIVSCNKVYKSELFSSVRFPIGKFHEDSFTTYKLFLLANKIAFTKRKLYFYRQHEKSITGCPISKTCLDELEAQQERIEYIRNSGPTDLLPRCYHLLFITTKRFLKRAVMSNMCGNNVLVSQLRLHIVVRWKEILLLGKSTIRDWIYIGTLKVMPKILYYLISMNAKGKE
jgi:glycosyltransferase involved in cell wall biosynthesis